MSLQNPRTAREPGEIRGFAVFVGINEIRALADGTSLAEVAEELRMLVERVAPSAQTFTSIAVAPVNSGGNDLDVVKQSLRGLHVPSRSPVIGPDEPVMIDLSRRRMTIGAEVKLLTFAEFGLLEFLVEHEGTAVTRQELVEVLRAGTTALRVSARTIDVHVRRLRMKLGSGADLVRTVHGVGYVFNRASDVRIRFGREQE